MSIELVMPSNHLILCRPLLLPPSILPSIRVFSNESVLHIRWSKYWSFSFSISPSNEYSGLISFRMDWLDLLAVQGILKSLLQHHSSKASIDVLEKGMANHFSIFCLENPMNSMKRPWSSIFYKTYLRAHIYIESGNPLHPETIPFVADASPMADDLECVVQDRGHQLHLNKFKINHVKILVPSHVSCAQVATCG